MLNVDIIRSRFIRIIGNIVKLVSKLFHKIFPKKRFTLPNYSKPLIKTNNQSNVPRIIWQTNFTNKVTLPLYVNYLFNRFMAPRYEYRFMDNDAVDKYIAENHPEALSAYKKLTVGAAKADLWRLLAIYKNGGLYIDMDGCLVARPENFLKDKNEMFIKAKHRKETDESKKYYATNYFFAAAPNNSKIKEYIDIILKNIKANRSDLGVWYLTGPGVMEAIMNNENTTFRHSRETCIQGAFTSDYFQYIDRPNAHWTKTANKDILES
ncbi:glycosyltransferase family 32 protein [Francisella philomiragia]|uniref:glycosyltransferase family 32 protein n=1 Tax=Francisella philomiragia TaxID=28110 RepID=UPI001B8AD469|nr:glycosyltransferase [Francisella philomiragia]QUE31489.1 glycosyl transferase [Francisella philomiragia]